MAAGAAVTKELVALVTGGASGLGRAVVQRLVGNGYKVAILDIPQSEGEKLATEHGAKAVFTPADVTSDDQIIMAFEKVKNRFGRLDALVNCAGIAFAFKLYSTTKREMCDLSRIQRTMDVNVVGTLNCIRHSIPMFMENQPDEDGTRGVIINTSSSAAYDGQTGQCAYAASKGAIVSMTLPLARDLCHGHGPGIRVMGIAPGLFDTPLVSHLPSKAIKFLSSIVPQPHRLGKPDEFAALVQHIIENPYLNGEVIRIDGALRMPP